MMTANSTLCTSHLAIAHGTVVLLDMLQLVMKQSGLLHSRLGAIWVQIVIRLYTTEYLETRPQLIALIPLFHLLW